MDEVNKDAQVPLETASEAVETAKEVAETTKTVLNMNTSSAIIKIVLMIGAVFFSIWLKVRGDKYKRDQARGEEARNDQRDHDHATAQNRTDNQQVQTDSQRADDFFKGE